MPPALSPDCELTLDRLAGDELRLGLAGTWTLAGGVPSTEEVEREVGGSPPARLTFDASGITVWDSGLLTFLLRVLDFAAERRIATDPRGLPEGVVRLLALARAVPPRGVRTESPPEPWIDRVGSSALRLRDDMLAHIDFLGGLTMSFGRMLRGQAWFRREEFAWLLQDGGAGTLGIASLVAVLIGAILAFVGAVQLRQFGAQIYVADLVAIGMTREMGALMTAIIVAGRTGASYASQLGTMTVNEEIDALETMAIPTMDYLVLPRVVALAVMTPLLALYANLVGILGGGLVSASMLGIGPVQYGIEALGALSLAGILSGLFKALVFGIVVAVAGCLRGLQCGRSAADVGNAANSAVVSGIVGILVADALITVVFTMLGI